MTRTPAALVRTYGQWSHRDRPRAVLIAGGKPLVVRRVISERFAVVFRFLGASLCSIGWEPWPSSLTMDELTAFDRVRREVLAAFAADGRSARIDGESGACAVRPAQPHRNPT